MLKTLESTYDIPFVLESEQDDYPWIRISPAGARERMFSIKITNISDVRLHIDFFPQTFSANLIEAMGRASGDSKMAFCEAVKLLQARGARVFMSINHHSVNPCDIMTWPDDKWAKIDFHAVIDMPPEAANDQEQVDSCVKEWGCLTMGAFMSLVRIAPIGQARTNGISAPETEGDRYSVIANRYERSAVNRFLCIAKKGYACSICGLDFEKKYGSIGRSFVHIHHIVPVSAIGPGYQIDPERDLIPVCPNCHAMLHRKCPPYLPKEIKEKIALAKRKRLGNADYLYEYDVAASSGDSALNTGDEYDADR